MIGGTVGVVGTTDPGRRRPRPPWRNQIDGNGKSKKKSRCGLKFNASNDVTDF